MCVVSNLHCYQSSETFRGLRSHLSPGPILALGDPEETITIRLTRGGAMLGVGVGQPTLINELAKSELFKDKPK